MRGDKRVPGELAAAWVPSRDAADTSGCPVRGGLTLPASHLRDEAGRYSIQDIAALTLGRDLYGLSLAQRSGV